MTESAWPLIDFAFLIVATLPVAILGFLWAISARERTPKWIYMGSKWSTLVLLLPWLIVTAGLVSDLVSGS